MAIEFRCSRCGKLLRTTDDKAGLEADCPGCGHRVTVPEAGAQSPPAFGEPPPAAPSARPAATTEPLDAAFRADEDDDVDDDVRDERPCPMCGERISARARKCRFCGEEVPGRRPRRDAGLPPGVQPHRGELLLILSIVGIGLLLFSICCTLLGLVSIPIPIVVLALAGGDLARMRSGEMDRRGESNTQAARIVSMIHLALAGLGFLAYAAFFGFAFFARGLGH